MNAHVTSREGVNEFDDGIVIVGGGLAAARTAEQLRRAGYSGRLTIVSDEVHLPYDRPPLSKEVLRSEVDDVALKPREFYDEKDIALRLGSAAVSLDTGEQTVTLADGTVLGYDELVIATGLVPRRIPSLPDLDGIRVLRSFDESMALRKHASAARHAVVVGAGFIGCEVAASLRGLGVDVVLVEPQPAPLASVLGEQIGQLVTRLHRDEGVDVRTGVTVAEVRGKGHVDAVVLTDGTELPADLVVVGIGSTPATEWLEGSGVEVDNGVICDKAGRTSAPNVWALGDVASWRDPMGHQARVNIGATSPTRPESWCPRCSGPMCPRAWSSRISGVTSMTSKSSAWGSRTPPTLCIWSRTTGASSLPITSAMACWLAWSVAGWPARS